MPLLIDYDEERVLCRQRWCQNLDEAIVQLKKVKSRLQYDEIVISKDVDGKIVDICLSIIDDYQRASSTNFINPDYVNPDLN